MTIKLQVRKRFRKGKGKGTEQKRRKGTSGMLQSSIHLWNSSDFTQTGPKPSGYCSWSTQKATVCDFGSTHPTSLSSPAFLHNWPFLCVSAPLARNRHPFMRHHKRKKSEHRSLTRWRISHTLPLWFYAPTIHHTCLMFFVTHRRPSNLFNEMFHPPLRPLYPDHLASTPSMSMPPDHVYGTIQFPVA